MQSVFLNYNVNLHCNQGKVSKKESLKNYYTHGIILNLYVMLNLRLE